MQHDLRTWAEHLRSIARRATPPADTISAPSPWFTTWRTGESPREDIAEHLPPDEQLWRALALKQPIPDELRVQLFSDENLCAPIFEQISPQPIEVWTEQDLSAMHALAHQVGAMRDDRCGARALGAARWHVENTQPDNATNRPWALHVFLILDQRENFPEARLYAETLLHNCIAIAGAPDPCSAEILKDVADALDRAEHA